MTWTERIVVLVLALALLGATVILIRRRRLREEYAVLWVVISLVVLALAVVPGVLTALAGWLHLEAAVALGFVVVTLLALVALYTSVAVSGRRDREKALMRDVASLRAELDRLRYQLDQAPPPPSEPTKPKPPSLRT